jgi:excisionase family DNA binding protein
MMDSGQVFTRAEWMSLRQLARYLPLSERTIRAWIHSPVDALPAVRVGGKILVKRLEVEAWLERHRVKGLRDVDLDSVVNEVLQGFGHGR